MDRDAVHVLCARLQDTSGTGSESTYVREWGASLALWPYSTIKGVQPRLVAVARMDRHQVWVHTLTIGPEAVGAYAVDFIGK